MEFEARKLAALNSLASPLPDKSRKGGVDAPIAPLIARINAHPAFFTTSSCSGRISISMSSPLPEQQQGEDQAEDLTNKTKKKKKGGDWSYVTHSEADAEEIVRTVVQSCGHNMEEAGQQQHGLMVFRFEPFILAVECRDLVAAQALVSCAISSGFRESGITSIRKRIIAAVRCSLRIEAPIAEDGHLLVSEDYLRFLVGIANVKMLNNHQRTQKFLSSFIDQVASPSHDEGIESTSQDIRRQSHESSKENHFPYECKGKPNIKERKLSELEKRQVRLLCRLDEVEARLCDLVPKYGGGVDHDASSAIGGALDQKPMGNRNIQGMDALAQLNVLFKDDLADSEVECVSAQECEQRIEKDLHDLCEKGRSRGVAFSSLSVPSEKLYRWGHSTCFLRSIPGMPSRSLLVFGGYGGSVRQCRQNDLVLLTIDDGKVQSICADNPPTARMGHTASLVGKKMVVIGGREDPSKPLGDVCVLLLDKVQWVYPQVRGAFFPPRHRHGAVTVGEKIYVFGGLDNVNVLGDLFILDTSLMQWSRAECAGRVPAPRYSHSLSVVDQKIYLFGGFDGRTVYGDLWVFNLVKLTWSTVKLISIPRFSHSMTISSGFLILLGGCPLTKHENAVSLLHVDRMEWVHAKTDLPSECLFVRHTATCIGDQIVIIGGGVSCYAFGIKFSPPFLMGLASLSPHLAVKDGKKGLGNFAIDHLEDEVMSMNDAWGLKIDKVHAKICKDNLKQLGWLDTKRKAKVGDDGLHIIFPITIEGVCELKAADAGHAQELLQGYRNAEFARSLIDFEILQLKQHTELKVSKQPLQVLHIAIFSLLQKCGMPPSLLHELPKRWERLDDMVVLPANSFTSEIWSSLGLALWTTVAKSLNVHRVARQARVKASSTRDSNLLLLFGCNGWVHHRENGILYCFDATKCMFSSGNISEKLRMAKLDCTGETIVDLFAGIGYFVLPFLLKANAKRVYACEWNPPALDALRYNLHANAVEDRCTVLEGDNRITAPHGVADRVCLGLLPTSEHCWDLAVKALRPAGGMLHIHGNVKDTEEQQWVDHVCLSIRSLSENDGLQWDVHATHVERVKWYAPHIRHLVVDVKCNWKDDSEFSMQSF